MTRASNLEFAGTERFQIERRLGEGGMGVVYEAYDREKKSRVALKTLRHADARGLAILENEFHALKDFEHPNLVRLGELGSAGELWFFTMELIEGVDFLAYVRAGKKRDEDRPYDEPRLRAALRQLARGISALHRAKKVHRDIKPSNILVTNAGRVVLLDFGLVTHSDPNRQSPQGATAGTAEYMAPEQALSDEVRPAADWYAMGVLLYQALTGHLPHSGKTSFELMRKKQLRTPPPPRQRTPDVPEDLDELCVELLRIDPARRPSGHEILEWLGADDGAPPQERPSSTATGFTQTTPFVGREAELALLRKAFEHSREGRAVTVFVHGESGLGKTELVREFCRKLAAEDERVVVLAGRCYERESASYDAFDGIAEALSRHLQTETEVEAARLLPRRAGMLPQLFPIMQQVRAIAEVPLEAQRALDPQERRSRMFRAFRELLARLAERRPVVMAIDDLQWAGADSLSMLRALMHPSEAPDLLLLCTARPGVESLLSKTVAGDVRDLHLGELPTAQACELVAKLAPRLGAEQARSVADDAAGHPLFILELVRHLDAEAARGPLRLDEALWTRISALDERPRKLLELLCVAGAPIAQETAAQAAGLTYGEYERAAKILRVAFLARTGGRKANVVEPYHDRVREAVLAKLSRGVPERHHRELAIALERAGVAITDPQALVRHFAAAGQGQRAAKHAETAALRANELSAFDQAAELFKTALELGVHEPDKALELRRHLGDALVSAGRGPEAAEVFLAAAETADAATRLECLTHAAEQLLTSGHFERGLDAMHGLLAEIGVHMPATPRGALASLLWYRAKLRLRGLGWKAKTTSQIAPEALARLDVYKAAGHGLGLVDSIRGMDFQARGLLLALHTGERARIARALFFEATLVASLGGKRAIARAQAMVEEAARAAEQAATPYLTAWISISNGYVRYFSGQFRAAADTLAEAEVALSDLGGAAWELSSTRQCRMWSLLRVGAFAEMAPLLSSYLRDAERRGDLYTRTSLIRSCHRVALAHGLTEDASLDLSQVEWIPPEDRYHLQHWYEFEARGEAALYEGRAPTMIDVARAAGQGLKRSLLSRVQMVRVLFRWLHARLLLAVGANNGGRSGEVRQASRLARRLDGEEAAYPRVMASLVHAGVAVQKGNHERARRILDQTVVAAEEQGMLLHLAAARFRRAELTAGDEGDSLRALARAWMQNEGIVDPDGMMEMIAPGFTRAGVRTLVEEAQPTALPE